MKKPITIAVGSTNPVKVEAVRLVAQKAWPDVVVTAVAVPSGISDMPMSDEETRAGATNRARAARDAIGANFGVGLEGGVHPEPFGLVLQGWVAVVDGNGRCGIGGAGRLPLPDFIAQRVLNGEELGPVMDDVLDDHNVRQKGGAIGALTNNLAMRGDSFALAVSFALAPFVTPKFYE